MGMFNTIDWQAELPDGRDPQKDCGSLGWQTKALGDLRMDRYIVTPDGRLYKNEWDIHYTGQWYDYDHNMKKVLFTEELLPLKEHTLGPYQEWIPVCERSTFVPFTGEFNFYGGVGDEWIEYVAQFDNGKLQHVYRDYDREWRREQFFKAVKKL